MPRSAVTAHVLFVLAILTSINGCTAVGFGLGAVGDNVSGKGSTSRLAGVRTGVEITMWLTAGDKLSGVYRGNRAASGEAATSALPASTDSLAPPPGSVILLETREGVQEIPVSSVLRVSVPVASGKVIGTLVGLALDVLIVAQALASMDFSLGGPNY